MEQIHKAIQALESDIGFRRPSWILLNKLKNAEKNCTGPVCTLQIFRNNPSRGVWLYYQIFMMAKMSKTEISAKIQKFPRASFHTMAILPNFYDGQHEQNRNSR